MSKVRTYWLLTALVVVALVAGGWFGLAKPQASKAAELRTEAATQRSANQRVQSQIAMLKEQAKNLPREQARLTEIAQKIPNNPALPAFIRALSDAAEGANIEIISLKPDKPQALNPAGPAGAAGPSTATAARTSASGTTGTATRTTGAATTPTVAPPSLAYIPVEIVVQGSYRDMQRLLSSFEKLSRAVLVGDLHIEAAKQAGPGGTGANVAPKGRTVGTLLEMKLTGRLFMTTSSATTAKAAPSAAGK